MLDLRRPMDFGCSRKYPLAAWNEIGLHLHSEAGQVESPKRRGWHSVTNVTSVDRAILLNLAGRRISSFLSIAALCLSMVAHWVSGKSRVSNASEGGRKRIKRRHISSIEVSAKLSNPSRLTSSQPLKTPAQCPRVSYCSRLFTQSSLITYGNLYLPCDFTAYEVGQKVEYHAIGGGNVENSATTGTITEILTEPEVCVKLSFIAFITRL